LLREDDEDYNVDLDVDIEVSSDASGNLTDVSGNSVITFKKYTYKEIEKEITDNYFDDKEYYSCALDILASYLKGHKIIYMEAKFYCETHLNCYMMPAILFSTAATVLSTYLSGYKWGSVFIAGLNGCIAFLLAIVNYLKLDAASEAHKISSHQYDKLQSTVEFNSGSVLLFRYNDLQKREYELEQLIEEKKEITNKLTHYTNLRLKQNLICSKESLILEEELKNVKINIEEHVEKIENFTSTI
jgi:hypothetical protein